jgi:hypothetical protein
MIQVALSTTEHNELHAQVSDVVSRINSKFGTIAYQPVVYLHQDIAFEHYLGLLTAADAFMITSLREGMNLTSHEFVCCQAAKRSPLIMSEVSQYGLYLVMMTKFKSSLLDLMVVLVLLLESIHGIIKKWQKLFMKHLLWMKKNVQYVGKNYIVMFLQIQHNIGLNHLLVN